jgi:hypothetical protein
VTRSVTRSRDTAIHGKHVATDTSRRARAARAADASAVLDKTQAIAGALLISLPIWFALLFVNALHPPRNGMIEATYIVGTLIVTPALCFRLYNHKDLERIRPVPRLRRQAA